MRRTGVGVFTLEPEYEGRIHRYAKDSYNDLIADIVQEVPQLAELDEDQIAKDAATYLTDAEKITFSQFSTDVKNCIQQCIDVVDNNRAYTYSIELIGAMYKLKSLFRTVYRRKKAEAETERAEKERKAEAERREREKQAEAERREREKEARAEQRKREEKAEAERRKREEQEREKEKRAQAERKKREEEEALREARQKEQEEQQRKLEAERKAKQEKEEADREEQEKWRAACSAVDPPTDDAKRYLNKPGEYDKFIQAAREAIQVYLKKGEKYLDDSRTFDYRSWLKIINQRKDEERQKVAAESQAREYNQRLNSEVARLKRSLCHKKKDHGGYFEKQVSDARYLGYSFNHFLTDEDRQAFDKTLVSIATRKLDELVSKDFRQFIDSKYWMSYFLLPSADYTLEGVPCLDFTFDVFAVVETRVWLKPGQKTFGDYSFKLPWRHEKGCSVLVQEPEFLGYHYRVLNPSDLGGYVWQSIPLVLLSGLLNGQTKPAGITILAASDSIITYKIPKFKDEVNIPDNFASYLRSIGSIDEMASVAIMTGKVAGIVKSELNQLRPEQEHSLSEGKIERRNTKKARAFLLFNEGKRPGDPKVKSLAIKPKTAYRYYQDWKKIQHSGKMLLNLPSSGVTI